MSQTHIMPAPEIYPTVVPESKWEREHRAFLRLLPSLLATHRDKFVAVHDGKVVGSGDDQTEVALSAYAQWGYVPIFVGRVSEVPQPPTRVASPRLHRPDSA
jgi:hypothetical protein